MGYIEGEFGVEGFVYSVGEFLGIGEMSLEGIRFGFYMEKGWSGLFRFFLIRVYSSYRMGVGELGVLLWGGGMRLFEVGRWVMD